MKSENFSDAKSEDPGLKNARLCGKKFMIPKERNNTLISNEAHGFLATFPALLSCVSIQR